ncbi:MAG: hypothetical protein GIW98_02480 [Candidatus Eremiobacteraeota bacterium]|nr:hypothetical protein [Candidatus Eremiobacteraeota bacterium]
MLNADALLAFVTLQRGGELAVARRNTRALRSQGAHEVGAEHYPFIVALHASWLVTLWLLGRSRPLVPRFVILYLILQAARRWVLRTLGARWTTRIIILPDVPPVTGGPYRFLKHPNYAIVALELPCASLAVGLPWHALVFGSLNLALLAWRMQVENAAWQDTSGNTHC